MNTNKELKSPKKRRLERERKHRRDTIVNIAEKFFITKGYEKTMVDKIAEEAGYSKATIYNYFESKDDLFIAVASKAFKQLFNTFETTFNQPNVTFELRSLGDAYVTFIDKYPDYAALFDPSRLSIGINRILMKEESNESLTESEKEFRHHQLKIEELMRNVIVETMKKSGVSSKLDPFSVIMALSTLDSAIRELLVRGSRDYLDVLFNIIDKGLKHYDD
ncbi:MAG: TetR/AcrR family transcriptional regulator [Candidatus Hodarchaeales archaeon]|jgi:AcrR family transcriptional regulator